VIPPEQIFAMWKLRWLENDRYLQRRFDKEPELSDQFLARSELAELSKMSRDTLRKAIDEHQKLDLILAAAQIIDRQPYVPDPNKPAAPDVPSNTFGYTSVERGTNPPRSRGGGF
jgi:hypothetical protein|tara:strand:+ start:315 stop:659 length:345 start_codon:yes stop_codon:yes gene_type:complete